jgi:hypothetical protein
MPISLKPLASVAADVSSSRPRRLGSNWLLDITREPDLLAVSLFVLVGLLIAVCLAHFIPVSADMVATISSAT